MIMAATTWKPFNAIKASTAGFKRHPASRSRIASSGARDAFPGRLDREEILFQDGFHGRVGQDELAQITLVRGAPGALALVTIAVAQEEAFEALARPAPVIDASVRARLKSRMASSVSCGM
jgi:hypothetical protein